MLNNGFLLSNKLLLFAGIVYSDLGQAKRLFIHEIIVLFYISLIFYFSVSSG